MNDEPPQLGAGLRGGLRCPEGGRVQLTADYLLATDRDSEDAELSYMLARRPARGELRRAGLAVDKFSQEDLLRGHVFYVHTGEVSPRHRFRCSCDARLTHVNCLGPRNLAHVAKLAHLR